MPEQETTQQAVETTATTAGAETTQTTEQTQQQPADFDAWLAKQPDDVKKMFEDHTTGLKSALDKERKANKKRDDEAARKVQEERDAQLSEADKLKKQLAQEAQTRQELEQKVRLYNAEKALSLAAEKDKIEFASAQAMRDAFEIALKDAQFDDEGNLETPGALLKAIVKDRDYLLKKATPPAGNANITDRGGSSTPVLDEAQKKELAARIGVNERYITN